VGASAVGIIEGSEPDGGVALEEGPPFVPVACDPVDCDPVACGSSDAGSGVCDDGVVEAGVSELVLSGAGSAPLSMRQPNSSEIRTLAPAAT
jgi:hypothetical protein